MSYIIYAIPVFFLLIGIELLFDKLRKTNYYRFNDAITNLSCGIGSQVSGIFLRLFTLIGYLYLYENYRLFDLPSSTSGHSVGAIIATGLFLFIGVDFFYYWFHRLAHEISILWGSHIVHHQSEEYNLTVALRQAWLQGAFSWVFYLPLALIGFSPIMFITINSFQTLYQFWIHTKTINKLPGWFEYVFNTPSHHRVHHGVNPKYIDKNHGGTLIIFDRIFGTFQAEEEEVVYGITKQTNSWNPLWVNFEYWIDLFREVGRASKWSDKIKMLLMPPGWKPEELGGVPQLKEVTPATFRKYDTQIPHGLNWYVFVHFILILGGATFFLIQADNLNTLAQIGAATFVILSLINLGGLFERRRWVFALEGLRVITLAFTTCFILQGVTLFPLIATVAVLFVVSNLIWLWKYRPLWKIPAVE